MFLRQSNADAWQSSDQIGILFYSKSIRLSPKLILYELYERPEVASGKLGARLRVNWMQDSNELA